MPIGHGQTISQPYIVAVMTDLLAVSRGDRVLEIGTGSGYQAAILSRVVKQVYSLEIIQGHVICNRRERRNEGINPGCAPLFHCVCHFHMDGSLIRVSFASALAA
mgnify:CR=1 FL=1